MSPAKQPTWLKEIELFLICALVIGANTTLSALHIIDPALASGMGMLLTGAILLAVGHKLGLTSIPVATLENIVSQFAAQAQALAPALQATPAPATPTARETAPSSPAPIQPSPVATPVQPVAAQAQGGTQSAQVPG